MNICVGPISKSTSLWKLPNVRIFGLSLRILSIQGLGLRILRGAAGSWGVGSSWSRIRERGCADVSSLIPSPAIFYPHSTIPQEE